MSRSRRTVGHPLVASTTEHAAAETTPLGGITATLEPTESAPVVEVPDSPASLWASDGATLFSVDALDCVPGELRDWVAPAIVVHAAH